MSVRAGREFLSTPGPTTTPDGALQAMLPRNPPWRLPDASRTDRLIVARTGIIQDYTCGPLGFPRTTIQTIDACRPAPGQTAVSQRGGRARPPSHWFLKRSLVLTKQGID